MASKNRIRNEKASAVEQDTNLGVSYKGTVTIAYQRKNKIYKAQVRHNKGLFPMFELLANALTGKVQDIEKTRPKYIRLFHVEPTTEGTFTTEVGASNIPYSEIWNTYSESKNKAYANFQFVIPYTYLSTNQPASVIGVNQIAIYSSENHTIANIDNPSAYVVLLKDDSSADREYDYLIADGKSNVVITWTMEISNNSSEE